MNASAWSRGVVKEHILPAQIQQTLLSSHLFNELSIQILYSPCLLHCIYGGLISPPPQISPFLQEAAKICLTFIKANCAYVSAKLPSYLCWVARKRNEGTESVFLLGFLPCLYWETTWRKRNKDGEKCSGSVRAKWAGIGTALTK